MIKKLFGGEIYAAYNSIPIFDRNADVGELPDWAKGDFFDLGYIFNGKAIQISTYAGVNDYWIDVYLSDRVPDFGESDRVIALNLNLESGILVICDSYYEGSGEEKAQLNIGIGQYKIYILGYNLVHDYNIDYEIISSDQQEFIPGRERYEIFVVPGLLEFEGVLKGDLYRL
jgi:hypothetical protein